MSHIAIRVENLSKQYRIGGPSAALRTGKQERYRTLREPVTAPLRCLSSVACGQSSAIESRRITCIIS